MPQTEVLQKHQSGSGLNLKAIIAGMIVTLVLTLGLAGVLALTVYFTDVNEGVVLSLLYYLGLATVAIGAAFAARWADGLGWVHGGLTALFYVSLAIIFGSVFFSTGLTVLAVVKRLVLAFMVGSIAGVFGVNV